LGDEQSQLTCNDMLCGGYSQEHRAVSSTTDSHTLCLDAHGPRTAQINNEREEHHENKRPQYLEALAVD
jgi:hypothetical protein